MEGHLKLFLNPNKTLLNFFKIKIYYFLFFFLLNFLVVKNSSNFSITVTGPVRGYNLDFALTYILPRNNTGLCNI